jgi:uncharacterized protein
MTVYSTPGVYFEWADTAPAIQVARTDIAGFVGIAERGPLHTPVQLNSWTQFTSVFGFWTAQGYLAYAVQGFFANGGRTCYVVRVADPQWAKKAALDLSPHPGSNMRLRLIASSEGTWANSMLVSVVRTSSSAVDTGKTRFHVTFTLPSGQQEVWRNLTWDEQDPRQAVRVLTPARAGALYRDQSPKPIDPANAGSKLVDACLLLPGDEPAEATLVMDAPFRASFMKGGGDGLWTLQPEHLNGALSADGQPWGLAALENIREIAIVAMPDLVPPGAQPHSLPPLVIDCSDPDARPVPRRPEIDPDVPPIFDAFQIQILEQSLVAHCELLKDRIAVIQPPPDQISPQAVIESRRKFDSSYAAMYFPWLRAPDPLELDGLVRSIPPCGHVAGMYARVENERGVYKPPANELIELAQDVTVAVDDAAHGLLNDSEVNVLRVSSARGLRVMGARTLSSDSLWRYVNVRRLLLMIERAIQIETQWLPFEPNNPDLWRTIAHVLRSFLDGLWRRGMLDGDSAEQAFTVDCSMATNPPAVTDQGQLIAVIGVQPPLPAEFVIVRIGRTDGDLQFSEGRSF